MRDLDGRSGSNEMASAPLGDKQAEEWMAMIRTAQKKGPDSVAKKKDRTASAKQLRLALKHLSNARRTLTWLGFWMLWDWPMRRTASRLLSDIRRENGRESAGMIVTEDPLIILKLFVLAATSGVSVWTDSLRLSTGY